MIQKPDYAQGLNQRSKIEEVPKMARQRGSVADNPEEGELVPAVDDHRCCKKNFTSAYPVQIRR